MNKRGLLAIFALAGCAAFAQPPVQSRRASMRGGGGDGKCTIEVEVDDVAEVEIRGDTGYLRTLSGNPANWRRFECNQVLPPNPYDFRFHGVDGRGRQDLVRDPQSNRGVAVIRIEDRQGGREGYTFDITWRGGSGPPPPVYQGGGGGRFSFDQAMAMCQDAVRAKADREFGYRDIEIRRAEADNNPGRRDWIIGSFEGRGRERRETFQFSCGVDFSSGRMRSVDITRMGGDVRPQGPPPGVNEAMRVCQDAVAGRIQRDGYRDVNFENVRLDDQPGRGDWIIGFARGRRGRDDDGFRFECSVDFRSSAVRSVNVQRR
jgi:hypothetical protein